jgi:hypothetical protein
MTDELELTIVCPQCRGNVRQRAVRVLQARQLNCARCGTVAATDDIVSHIRAAQAESERKFAQLDAASRFNLR